MSDKAVIGIREVSPGQTKDSRCRTREKRRDGKSQQLLFSRAHPRRVPPEIMGFRARSPKASQCEVGLCNPDEQETISLDSKGEDDLAKYVMTSHARGLSRAQPAP